MPRAGRHRRPRSGRRRPHRQGACGRRATARPASVPRSALSSTSARHARRSPADTSGASDCYPTRHADHRPYSQTRSQERHAGRFLPPHRCGSSCPLRRLRSIAGRGRCASDERPRSRASPAASARHARTAPASGARGMCTSAQVADSIVSLPGKRFGAEPAVAIPV